jgi:hypothetical protein
MEDIDMQLAANPNLRLRHIGLVVRAIEEALPLRGGAACALKFYPNIVNDVLASLR